MSRNPNQSSRYPANQRAAESARGQANRQVSRRVRSPERMSVPAVSTNPTNPSTSTSTSFNSPMTRSISSSFELAGSEYLEPTLAESKYVRNATSNSGEVRGSNDSTGNQSWKPWGGFAQYVGMQRGRSVAKKEIGSGAHRAPAAAEYEQRGRSSRYLRATEMQDRHETERDSAAMDSVEFEPTIYRRTQSSFANRKSYKSFGGSNNSSKRG
ncbi:0f8706b7-3555-48f3-8dba-5e5e3f6e354e-CDS [Sclerotinia trifoliorum]|uniref:0f8706b7-3555-48f3-8dba-5e5e3f6e354e-CDS n=1 Tax=Sclerotinia trifoliorum TaxID=28548 RepID=A0A8H2VS82_9HELO|nr:0f8706b7-3555-48f3-8dba-5e5e3f6e354e-CDS [Sclerotinia trifoliorum]